MTEIHRTRLEWARDTARAYRWALLKSDPDKCHRLDILAREAGQAWVAPEIVSAETMEEAANKPLSPPEIAIASGIPVGTIYSWVSRGLLKPAPRPDGESGPARYFARDVQAIDARRKARRLDSA